MASANPRMAPSTRSRQGIRVLRARVLIHRRTQMVPARGRIRAAATPNRTDARFEFGGTPKILTDRGELRISFSRCARRAGQPALAAVQVMHRHQSVALQHFAANSRPTCPQRHTGAIICWRHPVDTSGGPPYNTAIDDALPPPTGRIDGVSPTLLTTDCCEAAGLQAGG